MFAWGNPSRGDDAVGPWFAERFRCRAGDDFTLVEDFQLQVEHLLDCRDAEMLLFIDACCEGEGYRFEELTPSRELAHTSHALSPAELLGQYLRVFSAPPPPAFLLAVSGRRFDLGQAMAPSTRASCERALRLVERLLAEPGIRSWRARAASVRAAP